MKRWYNWVGLFHHEALLYAGEADFLAGAMPFVRAAVDGGEPVLVVLGPRQTVWLRNGLGPDSDAVTFADMLAVGDNPARIIPAWQSFVDAHPGRPIRGVGEPVWPGRSPSELVECHRHEALLNVAFADTPGFRLLCPYDTEGLDPDVVAVAHDTHPHVGGSPSLSYREAEAAFADPLPEPADAAPALRFDADNLPAVRAFVARLATTAGLPERRVADLVLAVSELAGNSVRHGGGRGVARVWAQDGSLVCEVADEGRILDPLAGRRRPDSEQLGGYGLWLANQLCDLVQVRTFAAGGVIRAHMRLPRT
jgi:anti-sigma regulatory factor (Ser/Thr protein kinase)